MAKKNVVTKLSLENMAKEIREWVKKNGLTQEVADQLYISIFGGFVDPTFQLIVNDVDVGCTFDSFGVAGYEPDLSYIFGAGGVILENGTGQNYKRVSFNLLPQGVVALEGFSRNEEILNLHIDGLTITGISAPQAASNPATKKYVDDKIGDINEVLDQINGEVV